MGHGNPFGPARKRSRGPSVHFWTGTHSFLSLSLIDGTHLSSLSSSRISRRRLPSRDSLPPSSIWMNAYPFRRHPAPIKSPHVPPPLLFSPAKIAARPLQLIAGALQIRRHSSSITATSWVREPPLWSRPLIRLQRIYNFWCSMLVFTPFA
jgi:hypothetical protein